MTDVKTHKVTVVADGISYRIPGQKEPQPPNTYAVLPAYRGQDIELAPEDYERFTALGAVVDADTHEAGLAKQGPLTGDPYGAVRISGENANLPIDKLKAEARRLGLKLVGDDEDEGPQPVSGEAPDDLDLSDERAVKALNVAQLKNAAARNGVELEPGVTKPGIVKALVAHGKAQKSS